MNTHVGVGFVPRCPAHLVALAGVPAWGCLPHLAHGVHQYTSSLYGTHEIPYYMWYCLDNIAHGL